MLRGHEHCNKHSRFHCLLSLRPIVHVLFSFYPYQISISRNFRNAAKSLSRSFSLARCNPALIQTPSLSSSIVNVISVRGQEFFSRSTDTHRETVFHSVIFRLQAPPRGLPQIQHERFILSSVDVAIWTSGTSLCVHTRENVKAVPTYTTYTFGTRIAVHQRRDAFAGGAVMLNQRWGRLLEVCPLTARTRPCRSRK